MCKTSYFAVFGLVMIVVAVTGLVISFCTPYWLQRIEHKSLGTCMVQDTKTTQFQDEIWVQATRLLMIIGFAMGLSALIVGASSMCCRCSRNCRQAVAVCLLGCSLSVGIGIIIFGVKAPDHKNATIDFKTFGWSYWLAVASVVQALLTSCLYFCAHCRKNSDA